MILNRWEIFTEDRAYCLSSFTLYGDDDKGAIEKWLRLALCEAIPINRRRCGDRSGVIVTFVQIDV